MILIDDVVLGIGIASLAIGTFEDIKNREIDKFLFIPLVLVGAVGTYFNQSGMSFGLLAVILLPVVLFFTLFVRFVPWVYALIGVASFAVAFYFAPAGYFLELVVILLIYLMGIGERFFGTGDIKAMLAICTGFYTPYIYNYVKPTYIQGIFPFDFSFLFTVSVVSIFSIFYVLAVNIYKGQKISIYSLFSFGYNEDDLKKNPNKYMARQIGGHKVMVYGIPFILPIFIGFLIVSAFGNWFIV